MLIELNGKKIEISAGADNNHHKCKQLLLMDIIEKVNGKNLEDQWQAEELAKMKKDFIAKLKEWDKNYNAHLKQFNPEIAGIQDEQFKPLIALMRSATDYYNLQNMLKEEAKRAEKEGEVPVPERIPEWRISSIEKVFVDDYSVICDYLTKYPGNFVDPKKRKKGEDPQKQLTKPYNIR